MNTMVSINININVGTKEVAALVASHLALKKILAAAVISMVHLAVSSGVEMVAEDVSISSPWVQMSAGKISAKID